MTSESSFERGDARQNAILIEAEARYGIAALFLYVRPSDRKIVVMGLQDAMTICGPHIAAEDPSTLWRLLDKWHAMAQTVERDHGERFEAAKKLGKQVLDAST